MTPRPTGTDRTLAWAPALSLLLAAACGGSSSSGPRTCQGDGVHTFSASVQFSGQHGVVEAEVKVDVQCILEVEVVVDGNVLGTSPSHAGFAIDTMKLTDGQHRLYLRAPGWADSGPFDFTTDNTPPYVTSCVPRAASWGQLSRRAGIDVVFSEPVCWNWDPNICHLFSQVNLVPPMPTPLSLPGHLDLDWSDWADQAKNPFAPPACGADYEAWLLPWGADPIPALAGATRTILGSNVAADPAYDPQAVLLRLEDGPGGRLRTLTGAPPDDFTAGDPMESTPGAQVVQLVGRSFIEQEEDGALHLRSLGRNGVTEVISLAPERRPVLQRSSFYTVAWTEDGAGGRRVGFEAIDLTPGQGDWWVLPPMVRPEADVLELFPFFDWVAWTNTVAVVDEVAGVPARFRLMALDATGTGWDDITGPLNRDLGQAASGAEFSYSGGLAVMAWAEGGQVLARMHFVPGTEGITDPIPLNADPTHPAHSPRVLLPLNRVLFVESWPDGDQIEFRQPHPYLLEFQAYPSIETGGEIVELETDADFSLTVLWTDSSGEVRVRAFNE